MEAMIDAMTRGRFVVLVLTLMGFFAGRRGCPNGVSGERRGGVKPRARDAIGLRESALAQAIRCLVHALMRPCDIALPP
ncbi:hypothetical protein J2W32_004729 [Variovorax boronicumulans]|uniref:Secreted protein n=1 Tax=Variovorax boronicumulans TaxID=436515 RepID=A0AAW8D699_9BURK|nr:hypothetical protein [Variovorax boronicumulans]MDP9895623.1 hypothetical protein [Variovorax boronicumulans]MDQ0055669.1 hypothetical protein [Variovorax boronicumulans]